MKDMTISEVRRSYGVSTRMLRYYEKEGLITCKYRPDYAYRIYDENAVRRLQQIQLLRRLRFSLKQIGAILNYADCSAGQAEILKILLEQLSEVEGEITSLQTIRDILAEIAGRSRHNPMALLEVIQRLPNAWMNQR